MAEPTFVAAGAYLAGSAANAAVAVPAGTAAGRVAIVTLFMDGAALSPAPTPPTGFQAAPNAPVQIASGSGSHSLYVWWKRLDAADAGTYTFTWTGSRYREAIATLWQDVVASGDPWDLPTAAATDLANSNTTPPVQVTSLGPDRRLIWSATNWGGGTWTAPTGFTRRAQGGAGVHTICDRSWPTAGATGPITGTCTGNDKRHAWLGALRGTTPDVSGVDGELNGVLPALGGQAAGTVTATGALAGSLGPVDGSFQAAASVRGTVAASLPPVGGSLASAVTVDGAVNAVLPALGGQLDGNVRVAGSLGGVLPPLAGGLDGALGVAAALDATMPALTGGFDGVVRAHGSLAGALGAVGGGFTGTVESQGGVLVSVLPPLGAEFTGGVRVDGAMAGLLAAATVTLTGTARARGTVDAVLPALGGSLHGHVLLPSGDLDARLPALAGAFTGTSSATDLPPANPQPGPPRLGWPVAHPSLRWPVGSARTSWPVRPPSLGGD